MTTLTASQIYALNRQAGFDPVSAITATAIALAESNGNTAAIGDLNNPGPGAKSVGLFQINYLPSRDQSVPYRDPTANLDPLTNAKAAFIISNGGKNFSPWTKFINGGYKQFIGAASQPAPQSARDQAIAAAVGPTATDKTIVSDLGKFALSPGSVVGSAAAGGILSGISSSIGKDVAKVGLSLIFVLAGVAALVFGVARATGVDKKIAPAANTAAKLAVL